MAVSDYPAWLLYVQHCGWPVRLYRLLAYCTRSIGALIIVAPCLVGVYLCPGLTPFAGFGSISCRDRICSISVLQARRVCTLQEGYLIF